MATPYDSALGLPDSSGILPLSPQEFDRIRQLARRTFGLDLKAGKEELVSSRLRRLVRDGGFRSFHEYYRHIVEEPSGIALESMIDALATNHTAFNREPAHFEFLRAEVLPQLSRRTPLEVWSAACSTGEEVWTLACVLNDVLPSRQIHITASDISTRALKFAEHAMYGADRCQGLSPTWLSRYFVPVEGAEPAWRVAARIRFQATFRRVNLVERYMWPHRFPVIFCRNVMIYFDSGTQEEVVRQLADCLEPGGYLFVGHAESLTRISHPLEYVRPAVYRKPAEREARWRKSI
jgi:chemotaxis protein methyltransferase CheR